MSSAPVTLAKRASIPARIARDGSSGVEGIFAIDISPVCSLRWTKSENVPPVSTVTR
jgi:hypothetical protein